MKVYADRKLREENLCKALQNENNMNQPPNPNRTRRIAYMISGAVDALIGAVLLLIGFGLLPVDTTNYGFANWHVNLLGALMFILGAGTFAYNLSRLEE